MLLSPARFKEIFSSSNFTYTKRDPFKGQCDPQNLLINKPCTLHINLQNSGAPIVVKAQLNILMMVLQKQLVWRRSLLSSTHSPLSHRKEEDMNCTSCTITSNTQEHDPCH